MDRKHITHWDGTEPPNISVQHVEYTCLDHDDGPL